MSAFSGIFDILVQHEKAILWESLDPFIKKVAMIVAYLLAIAKISNCNFKNVLTPGYILFPKKIPKNEIIRMSLPGRQKLS